MKRRRVSGRVRKLIRDNKGVFAFLALLFIVRGSFADHMRVPSGSMIPNIQIGDHIMVNKTAYRLNLPFTQYGVSLRDPVAGDVVVFEHPNDPSINLVKRLIAGPGDLVLIDPDGSVSVNGKKLSGARKFTQEDDSGGDAGALYVKEKNKDTTYWIRIEVESMMMGETELEVPAGHFFFMGDNRDNSSDSRSWGVVSRDLLIGEAVGVLFSVAFNEMYIPEVQWRRFGADLSSDVIDIH